MAPKHLVFMGHHKMPCTAAILVTAIGVRRVTFPQMPNEVTCQRPLHGAAPFGVDLNAPNQVALQGPPRQAQQATYLSRKSPSSSISRRTGNIPALGHQMAWRAWPGAVQ